MNLTVPDMEKLREAAQCGRLTRTQIREAAKQAAQQAVGILDNKLGYADGDTAWSADLLEFAASMLRHEDHRRAEEREARIELLKGVGS